MRLSLWGFGVSAFYILCRSYNLLIIHGLFYGGLGLPLFLLLVLMLKKSTAPLLSDHVA